MKNIANAIKKQGFLCITMPIAPTYREIHDRERIYDFKSINRLIRLSNLRINIAEYYMPTRQVGKHAFNWVRATKNDIIEGSYLRIYPHAVACLILVNNPPALRATHSNPQHCDVT